MKRELWLLARVALNLGFGFALGTRVWREAHWTVAAICCWFLLDRMQRTLNNADGECKEILRADFKEKWDAQNTGDGAVGPRFLVVARQPPSTPLEPAPGEEVSR